MDDLTDKDRLTLNEMARKYGIHNYARLLRMAKMDRDDQLRELQANQKVILERRKRHIRKKVGSGEEPQPGLGLDMEADVSYY